MGSVCVCVCVGGWVRGCPREETVESESRVSQSGQNKNALVFWANSQGDDEMW